MAGSFSSLHSVTEKGKLAMSGARVNLFFGRVMEKPLNMKSNPRHEKRNKQ
jgi:hypothetical protein